MTGEDLYTIAHSKQYKSTVKYVTSVIDVLDYLSKDCSKYKYFKI